MTSSLILVFGAIVLLISLAIDFSKPDGSQCLLILTKLDISSTLWQNSVIGCTISFGLGTILVVIIGAIITTVIGTFAGVLGG